MTKTKLTACLLATVLAGGTALAQTGTSQPAAPSGSNMNTTAPAAPATTAPATTMGSAGTVQFITNEQSHGQMWRASKLMGVNIYGPNDEKVGDVNEVLLDHQGNVKAVVIGVGGFLGIGEKDVAMPFNAIQWMSTSRNTAMSNNATTANTANRVNNPPAGTTAGTTAATNPPATNPPAGTAPRATTETTGTTVARTDMDRAYPDHGVISMTKDQIKAAPSYRLER